MSSKQKPGPFYYTVDIEGTKYREEGKRITDIVVEQVIDGADRFAITLNYSYDRKNQKFAEFSPDKFKAGKKVTISVGWSKRSNEEKLFVGKIQNLQTEFGEGRGPKVGISGYGLLHDMMRGTPDNSWEEVALKKPVDETLGSYFGKKEVKQASTPKLNKIIQHDESDYLFVKRLADKYGFQFYTERDKVLFIPRKDLGSSSPVETLDHDKLDSISGEINEADEIKEVSVRSWDMTSEKEIVGSAQKGNAKNSKKKVYRIPCESKAEADKIAQNKLNGLSKVKASVHAETSMGKPKIMPNTTVELENVGKKFSNKYYITKATHRLGDSGYKTSFEGKEVV